MSASPPPKPGPEFWDQRYGEEEFAYGTDPNVFLKESSPQISSSGNVLCLAEGEGRNAVFLAKKGLNITAVDSSSVGLEKAKELAKREGVAEKIETIVADLSDYDLGNSKWDAIVCIFCHLPPPLRSKVHRACVAALKPGGKVILEAYNPQQLEYKTGGPPALPMLFTKDMLVEDFEGLKVVTNQELVRDVVEGKFHTGKGAVVQFIAVKE